MKIVEIATDRRVTIMMFTLAMAVSRCSIIRVTDPASGGVIEADVPVLTVFVPKAMGRTVTAQT